MPWTCAVPNCRTNKDKRNEKVSVFIVKNENFGAKWAALIPGIERLRTGQRICEKHFEERYIIREYIKYDNNGKIIAQVPLKRTRLRPGAVPTIFDGYPLQSRSRSRSPQQDVQDVIRHTMRKYARFYTDHTYAVQEPAKCSKSTAKEEVTASSTTKCSESTIREQEVIASNRAKYSKSTIKEEEEEESASSTIKYPRSTTTEEGVSASSTAKYSNSVTKEKEANISTVVLEKHQNEVQEILQLKSIKQDEFVNNDIERYVHQNNECFAIVSLDLDSSVPSHYSINSSIMSSVKSDVNIDCSINNNMQPESFVTVTKAEDNLKMLHFTSSGFPFTTVMFDSIGFNFESQQDDTFENNAPLKIPKPWIVGNSKVGDEEALLFTYAIRVNDCGKEKHIFAKSVLVTGSRKITYEIYMTPVDVIAAKLPRILTKITMIPEILKKFKDLRTCKGITSTGLDTIRANTALKNCIGTDWRHADCSILSIMSERCNSCKKYSNTLSQKIRRMKKRTVIKRVTTSLNPFDEMKLKTMREKIKYKDARVNRMKDKLKRTTDLIVNQQKKACMICMTDSDLDKISKNQKLVIQEIISAAKTKDPKGRRYTDEFIMMCMLMNIKSQSYYEFLRKNEIIPLPCARTIRDYMSQVGTKRGFDEKFVKLLKESQCSDPR
ncbi:uncharacterized protein LOC117232589 isoform X1 [Bombus vosnesenskii]|uniref:Uncharacterized protein LOC117232589 isoform X1 n=1 Tax=Bombus vosnesenskii TaxID=207650 RepID=A0A6J3K490_9HYME|nr:uncharacterized protein LOC117232589 isoform X1 [Bombus vosnesenskii]